MLEKGQIYSGMLLVVFAVNESQKKRTRYTSSRSQARSGEATLNFDFTHGAVAPRLTDRGRPAQHHQTNGSTAAAAAAAQ